MNIQEYSKKFMIFLNVLTSSIILWGQNNDGITSKKLEKNHEIQPTHTVWVIPDCIGPNQNLSMRLLEWCFSPFRDPNLIMHLEMHFWCMAAVVPLVPPVPPAFENLSAAAVPLPPFLKILMPLPVELWSQFHFSSLPRKYLSVVQVYFTRIRWNRFGDSKWAVCSTKERLCT